MTDSSIPATSESLARLESYAAQDPGNLLLLADLFDQAMSEGAFGTAAKCVDRIRSLHPSNELPPEWIQREIALATSTGDASGAALAAEALQARVGANELSTGVLAQIALARGDVAVCLAYLEKATDAKGDILPNLAGLKVRALHHAGRLEEAVALTAARAAGDSNPDLLSAGSVAALDLGNYDAAAQWSAAALARDSSQLDALVTQATLAIANQQGARAIGLLAEPLARRPHDGRTTSALGFALLSEGRIDDAAKALARALETMPMHVGTWLGLGWALLMQGDARKALEAFEEAVLRDRNFADSHGSIAVALARLGDRAGAEAAIRRARGLDVRSMAAQYAELVLAGRADDVRLLKRLATEIFSAAGAFRIAPQT